MNEFLDNCHSIEQTGDDVFKDKTRIAEVAAATLCRLNSIMKQMKDWRDDRMKLRSNIWRLKLALRVAGRETDGSVHADPLIEQQKEEIKRLETTNRELKKEIANIKSSLLSKGYVTQETDWKSDDKLVEVEQEYLMERERLNNEIQYLKSRLNEVEEGHVHSSEVEHLKCKLKHFMMVDYTMEIIFTDIVNKVAETIANLSEELVNVNERLHKSQMRNDNLYVEIDKLKAMLRFKNGNLMDYQRRIVELDNVTKRLKTEVNKFKVNYDESSWSIGSSNLKNVERFVNDLKYKLRNDHEALLGGGDPYCFMYIQKIIELRINLRQLHIDLAKSIGKEHRTSGKLMEHNEYMKQLSKLDSILKEINNEIDKLKSNHVKRHYKIGDSEGLEYLNKIVELEAIIEEIQSAMNRLNRCSKGKSNESKDIEKLEEFVGRVCHEIKQLEVIVVSSDRLSVFKRIDQLEESIVRLKTELSNKEAHMTDLDQELVDTDSMLKQKMVALQDARHEITILIQENKVLKEKTNVMEEKTSELQCEHDDVKKELEQLQYVKHEANLTKKKLQNLQGDKEELLNEMQKIRDALNKKNEETKIVLAEKNTMERVFNVKIADLSKNLQISSKENEKLQNKVNELERMKYRREASNVEKENESARRLKDITEKMNNEIQLLKVNLKISKEDFNQANREIADLKIKLEHLSDEKTKLESSVAQLESKKEILVYQLAAEKTTAEERLKEITKLKSDYVELDVEKVNLKMEKEQLNANFTNLKVEKEQIEKSLELVQSKCSVFESKIDKYKCERNNLLEEVRNLKVTKETLTIKLEETKSQLDGTGDKIRQLDVENSKLHIDLNELTVKKTNLEQAFETREQTLLSENHDLATRVNKLDEENQTLKNQLKECKTTNEYSNVELSKLKTEYDNVKLENTTQLDELKQCNEMLKEMNNELKMKLNEIHSEYRILENQLKILELMNTTLKKEKELLEKEYMNTLQKLKMERLEKEGITSGSESVSTEQNEDMGKFEKRLKKEKIPEKEVIKKLILENESLKFEILNLKSQNYEIKTQLTQTKEEIQRQKSNAVEKKTNETTIKPISNKLEIVNLYYKEINSYSSRGLKNTEAVTHIDQSSLCLYEGMNRGSDLEIEKLLEIMNKLKVENIALRMEVNSLRCNLIINFSEEEKKKKDLRIATDEIQALKSELKKLRDERESLRIKFNTTNAKLDLLESEKAALKNELYTIRNINSDFKQKISDLNSTYQKTKEKNLVFENCIVKAIKKIEKYTLCDNMQIKGNNELKILLKKYISNEEILQSIEQRIDIETT
ncbi:coiled-coil domain-containing protein 39-like [Apis dorsata]|uniref:coiled-coil domain-containing protein 39-like n=1 Tax=Apis dorsata TaxID=7462 RepID=UPI0003DF77CA|nr:coiled-coil domain-containing protein 39-like [Apis dorsata]